MFARPDLWAYLSCFHMYRMLRIAHTWTLLAAVSNCFTSPWQDDILMESLPTEICGPLFSGFQIDFYRVVFSETHKFSFGPLQNDSLLIYYLCFLPLYVECNQTYEYA